MQPSRYRKLRLTTDGSRAAKRKPARSRFQTQPLGQALGLPVVGFPENEVVFERINQVHVRLSAGITRIHHAWVGKLGLLGTKMITERFHTPNRYSYFCRRGVWRRMAVEVNHRLAKPDLHVQGRIWVVFKAMFPFNLEAEIIGVKRLGGRFIGHPKHGDGGADLEWRGHVNWCETPCSGRRPR